MNLSLIFQVVVNITSESGVLLFVNVINKTSESGNHDIQFMAIKRLLDLKAVLMNRRCANIICTAHSPTNLPAVLISITKFYKI